MKKRGYKLWHVIVIMIVTSVISALTTGVIFISGKVSSTGISYSTLTDDVYVKEFLDVYAELVSSYYEDIDKGKMIENAISGMMTYLDETYTTYLDEETAESLMQQLNGKYTGIGITIQQNIIIDIMDDSPAQSAGLQIGDKIVSVDNNNVEDKSSAEISLLIKRNEEKVNLGILRGEETLNFEISLQELDMPATTYQMIENTDIGYLEISIFSKNLTDEVQSAITELKNLGMQKLIIDLRSNTGGLLDEAQSVAEIFLKEGQRIYSLEVQGQVTHYLDESANFTEFPIVVLVNGSTASASEILTSALKDSYNAGIVGTTTYGKGKVQHTHNLTDGGLVKYTSSRWLRPNGECIDEVGITPDYLIENELVYDNTDPENPVVTGLIDKQLEKAIELLSF